MITVMAVVAVGATSATVRDPGVGGVSGRGAPSDAPIRTAAVPKTFTNVDVNGGYVAVGVGLRNRGFGTIEIRGIPTGARVHSAYLFWSVLGGSSEPDSFRDGRLNGVRIKGERVGKGDDPCWDAATTGYAYRAKVTSHVKGNGNYALSRFASGVTSSADPFTTAQVRPLAEGASLVVIYSKASYPRTRVTISNGYGLVSTATGLTTTMPFGFAATNPVGQVQTTFIGADGQKNFTEPASTVNGEEVSAADWDGTDTQVNDYSQGNLWDTDTADVGKRVKPGDTGLSVKVAGGPDCLVWVAQVLSIGKNGADDTDGDKLLDGWEANGYDADNDGKIDVDLPKFGSSVVRKDLYVEMDYMGAEATCPCHLPLTDDLNRIKMVFADAPFANNPNGATGVNLHLDAGSARGAEFDLGGGNLVAHDDDLNPVFAEFSTIKSANFSANRAKIFYYMIWAHGYDGGTSSGNAFAIPNDSFVVTLGKWASHGTSDQKVGTFVHEFGHDLGLFHGGDADVNRKPNYLSVMSYSFQTTGVPQKNTAPYFGYSRATLPSLDEGALDESVGLNSTDASTYRTRWFCPTNFAIESVGTANEPLDWNCDGVSSGTVKTDINGATGDLGDGLQTTLTGWNDWANLVYGGGAVGPGAPPTTTQRTRVLPKELTWDEAERYGR
jgi:hypothetical protein